MVNYFWSFSSTHVFTLDVVHVKVYKVESVCSERGYDLNLFRVRLNYAKAKRIRRGIQMEGRGGGGALNLLS
jgi:hypothetical protein